MTVENLYDLYLKYPSIQTDSRKIKKDEIFFALSGPNFNGNQFALTALESGASFAVVDQALQSSNEKIILVDDVLKTLQSLAKYHRQQFNIPFIAITGSNGKTTTKELVSTVLASTYKTYTTEGNLNNHIGIPITLLRIMKDAEMAVIEMGANHQKEIEDYCKYVLPTHGIITNCGKAHLEGFGGIEGVRKGKGELFDFLRANDGTAFVYNDLPDLVQMGSGLKQVITYGERNAFVNGQFEESEPFLKVQITSEAEIGIINTNLVGDYNLPNVLCAVAVGKFFSVPANKIKTSLETYYPTNSRSQMLEKGSNKIILDAYNANPSSTKAAIENFLKIPSDKKILMLGGMMELGDESLDEHKKIIELINKSDWNKVVLVGGDYKKVQHSYTYFDNSTEARAWFEKNDFQNAYILIKGSRSIQMEKILG